MRRICTSLQEWEYQTVKVLFEKENKSSVIRHALFMLSDIETGVYDTMKEKNLEQLEKIKRLEIENENLKNELIQMKQKYSADNLGMDEEFWQKERILEAIKRSQ